MIQINYETAAKLARIYLDAYSPSRESAVTRQARLLTAYEILVTLHIATSTLSLARGLHIAYTRIQTERGPFDPLKGAARIEWIGAFTKEILILLGGQP